jgi:hypothetical protein
MRNPTALRVQALVGAYKGQHRSDEYAAVCTCPSGAPGPGEQHHERCAVVIDRVNRLHIDPINARWRAA